MKCPGCGEDDPHDGTYCPNCQRTWYFEDIASDSREDVIFTWIFECKNCGWVFTKDFKDEETVRIDSGSAFEQARVDSANGNKLRASVDGKSCYIKCECCGVDHMLAKVDSEHYCDE